MVLPVMILGGALIQGYLLKQAVGLCSSGQACYCWLVWDVAEVDAQVVLEHLNIPMVTVP